MFNIARPLAVLLLAICLPVQARSHVAQKHGWYKDYYPDKLDYCFVACRTAIRGISFEHPDPPEDADFYAKELSNTLKMQSTYYCAQAYCTPEEAEHGRLYVSKDFESNTGEALPLLAQYRLSSEELARVPTIAQSSSPSTTSAPTNHAAIPDAAWHARAEKTIRAMYDSWDLGFQFSFMLTASWVAVVLVGLSGRAVSYFPQFATKASESRTWTSFRRVLLLPAAFGSRQAIPIRQTFTIPPRLESLTLLVYAIMNVYMCLPGYELFAGNLYWDSVDLQLARYISDRMGFLSIAQLPMIWVFAARNNLLLWLTGWSYATYNRFHRWIASISVALAIGHSIGYSVMELKRGPDFYFQDWLQEYWYMGEIAMVIMSLMLPLSAYYIRQDMYDLFLAGHIILSIVFFVTLWYHVRIFDGEFNYFLYPCTVVWILDRLLRVKRVIQSTPRGICATAFYNHYSGLVRLDVTDMIPHKEIVPGQFYFIYLPAGMRGYESHPFTLCSWKRLEGPSTTNSNHSPRDAEENLPKETDANSEDDESKVGLLSQDHSSTSIAHTFLIRPYNGMTGGLRKQLLSGTALSEGLCSTKQMTVFLEGPYGENLKLSGYSDVLFICGGAGIATAISHSHSLQNSRTKVHIVWAVQQQQLLDDVCALELKSVLQDGTVDLTVHLTGSRESAEEAKQTEMESLSDSQKDPAYELKLGRPEIESTMRQYRQRASQSLAIVTCGTAQLSDACRKAVVTVLSETGVPVGYYNQTLMW